MAATVMNLFQLKASWYTCESHLCSRDSNTWSRCFCKSSLRASGFDSASGAGAPVSSAFCRAWRAAVILHLRAGGHVVSPRMFISTFNVEIHPAEPVKKSDSTTSWDGNAITLSSDSDHSDEIKGKWFSICKLLIFEYDKVGQIMAMKMWF